MSKLSQEVISTANKFGARIIKLNDLKSNRLSLSADVQSQLQELAPLMGKWQNVVDLNSQAGWNVISVPDGDSFALEVIPYFEQMEFFPAIIEADNRGSNGIVQHIVGLIYKQNIWSDCTTEFCKNRGFKKGNQIHAETGFFMKLKNENGGHDFCRMANIPHGNALLALGNISPSTGKFHIDSASTEPVAVDGTQLPFGYSDQFIKPDPNFPEFNILNPNATLEKFLAKLGNPEQVLTFKMSTDVKGTSAGILNIPFIHQHVDTTKMDATFWYEKYSRNKGCGNKEILQYTQTINIVFPVKESPVKESGPIIWPHVTVNTMKKVRRFKRFK